jgi:hypothetical protein
MLPRSQWLQITTWRWQRAQLNTRALGIVEPVFGNLRNNMGLLRFTLRGKSKVNIHW